MSNLPVSGSATSQREAVNRRGFSDPPSERELLALVVVSGAVMWTTAFLLNKSTSLVLQFGDNKAYLQVANSILHWDFRDVFIQHFMGYPYFIATASLLFRVPTVFSLWFIAVASSSLSTWLAGRLFGTVTAAYFALTNFAWLQASFIGGSEPLAVALGLGALLAFRRNYVFLAALLGSMAVIVRPLMIFVLVGIGLVLLYRKQIRSFVVALGTGSVIGVLYALPLAHYFGDPLLTVHSYTTRDYGGGGVVGPHGRLFGWPFHGIVAGTLAYHAPWTNLLLSFFWIGLVIVGIGMMFSKNLREYAIRHPNEAFFCGLYLLAIFSYDYLIWARSTFIRFSIPILPFVFFAVSRFLPKDRRLLWALCIVSSVLSAFSAVGIRNVIDRHTWRTPPQVLNLQGSSDLLRRFRPTCNG
jgi:hypothetical protein